MAPQNQRYAQYQERAAASESRTMLGEACHETEELVRENPGATALVTLGVGFGLGLLLASALTPRRQQNWYEPYMPDISSQLSPFISDMSHRYHRAQGNVSSALSRMMPDFSRHASRSWF